MSYRVPTSNIYMALVQQPKSKKQEHKPVKPEQKPAAAAAPEAKKQAEKPTAKEAPKTNRNLAKLDADRVAEQGSKGRIFDRRSGTGRGSEIKKDGGGKFNWGSDKDATRPSRPFRPRRPAPAAEEKAPASPVVEEKAPETAEATTTEEKPAEEAAAPAEEEGPKEKGLDEYFRELKKNKPKVKLPSQRVVSEELSSADYAIDAKWKNAQVLKREESELKVEKKPAAASAAAAPAAAAEDKKKKKVMNIQQFLKDVDIPERPQYGERRGGPRGPRREGGERRQPRNNKPAPAPKPVVVDEQSFPALKA